jgi:hypothetical protein
MGMITRTYVCEEPGCKVFHRMTVHANGPDDTKSLDVMVMMANADGWDITDVGVRCPAHKEGNLSSV